MPATASVGNFGDLLDVRHRKIFFDAYEQDKDWVPTFFNVMTSDRYDERFSSIGALPEFIQFSGSISYEAPSQGYDVIATPVQFARGYQVERRLFDTAQHNVLDRYPQLLALSGYQRRQQDALRWANLAFSVDNFFANNTEGVAVCSNSHTTTSGASTSTGFDNLNTTALTATSLATARINMRNFRNDQAQRISLHPDTLLIPPDLYQTAFETVASLGKPGVATNDANVHYRQYEIVECDWLTDTNNWFLIDSRMMKAYGMIWLNAVPLEFGFVEDFDNMNAKYRGYTVYGALHVDWRWVLGSQVS